MLKKPIVLSLLFILILFLLAISLNGILYIIKMSASPIFTTGLWSISAILVGITYTKTNKEPLTKNQKARIMLYSIFILLTIFLTIMAFMLDVFNLSPFHLIVRCLSMILPTILIIISGACIYPALGLGCKISNPDISKNIGASKLQDCLLIVFFIVLEMFFYQYNGIALNAIKPTAMKLMEQKGYIKKTEPVRGVQSIAPSRIMLK